MMSAVLSRPSLLPIAVYCPTCHDFMERTIGGVDVPTKNGLVRRGDLFQCNTCGISVVTDFGDEHPANRAKPDVRIKILHPPPIVRFKLPLEAPA